MIALYYGNANHNTSIKTIARSCVPAMFSQSNVCSKQNNSSDTPGLPENIFILLIFFLALLVFFD